MLRGQCVVGGGFWEERAAERGLPSPSQELRLWSDLRRLHAHPVPAQAALAAQSPFATGSLEAAPAISASPEKQASIIATLAAAARAASAAEEAAACSGAGSLGSGGGLSGDSGTAALAGWTSPPQAPLQALMRPGRTPPLSPTRVGVGEEAAPLLGAAASSSLY